MTVARPEFVAIQVACGVASPICKPMTDTRQGILRLQPSGRWAICRIGEVPFEITSGDMFRVEVDGELRPTRMEFRHFTGPMKGRELFGQAGEYYSCDGYHLGNSLRATIGPD
jgi:hypothetical protein